MFGLFVCGGSGWFYFETMRVGSNTCLFGGIKKMFTEDCSLGVGSDWHCQSVNLLLYGVY